MQAPNPDNQKPNTSNENQRPRPVNEVKRPKRKRSKKLLFIVVLLALVLGFSVLSKDKKADEVPSLADKKSTSDSQPNIRVYDSAKYVFGMPESWAPLSAEEAKAINASGGIKSPDGKALATMSVTPKVTDPKKLLSELEGRLKSLPDYKKLSSKDVKIDKLQGVELSYTFTNKGVSTQQVVYAASKNNEIYYLALTAAQNEYAKYNEDWNKIVSSYRIK